VILLTGATGYVGSAVAERLVAEGRTVRALVRADAKAARLPVGAEAILGDVTDPASLRRAMEGVEAAVHLVAILDGPDERFERVNAQGPRNVADAARDAGVRRIVHMSALGVNADNAPLTRYWRSKWAGAESVVGSGLDWTIIEPSFVFGRGGGALASFETLLRLPVVPVIGDGRYRHQPVWIGDVAAAFSAALDRPQTIGRRIPVVGPQALTFDELLDELGRAAGIRRRPRVHVPPRLMRAQTPILRRFPEPLRVTDEQITMLLAGTEAPLEPMRELLGIEPASIADAYTR
jgi:NADH dehydrogenase